MSFATPWTASILIVSYESTDLEPIGVCLVTLFKIGLNGKMKIDKNASNQKMGATFNNQLFKMYNFVAWPKNILSL